MMYGLIAMPFRQCWPRACAPSEPLPLTNVPWARGQGGGTLVREDQNSNFSLLMYPIRIYKFLWKILEYCSMCWTYQKLCSMSGVPLNVSIYPGVPNFPQVGEEGPASPGCPSVYCIKAVSMEQRSTEISRLLGPRDDGIVCTA